MNVRAAMFWAYLGRYASYAIQLATAMVIARLLTPNDVGVFGVGLAIAAMITVFKEFGATTFLVREPELTTAKVQTVFGVMLLIYTALALLVALASPIVAHAYDEPRLSPILLLLAVSIVLAPFGTPAGALLQREMQFFPLFLAQLASSLIGGSTGIALAVLGLGPVALGWASLANALVLAGMQLAFRPGHLWLRPSLSCWRLLFDYGSWLSLSSLITSAFARLPDLLLVSLIDFSAVGFFGRAVVIVEAVSAALVSGATSALFPALAKMHREGKPLGEPYIRLLTLLTGLTWPVFATIALIAEPLIRLLFGDNWLSAAPLLRWLALAQIILGGVTLHYSLLLIQGRTRLLFVAELCQSSLGLGLFCLGAMHGLEMAAASRIPYAILFLCIYVPLTRSLVGYTLHDLMTAYARSGAVALAVAAIVGFVAPTAPTTIAATCLAAALTGLGVGVLVHHPAIDEIRRVPQRWQTKGA